MGSGLAESTKYSARDRETSVNQTNTKCDVVKSLNVITRNLIIATRLEKMQTNQTNTKCDVVKSLNVITRNLIIATRLEKMQTTLLSRQHCSSC